MDCFQPGGDIAKILGFGPLVIEVKEIKPIPTGYAITTQLCFNLANNATKLPLVPSHDSTANSNKTVNKDVADSKTPNQQLPSEAVDALEKLNSNASGAADGKSKHLLYKASLEDSDKMFAFVLFIIIVIMLSLND